MSQRPSCTIESITCALPRRYPLRACGRRYGALVIDSIPPATTIELFPVCTACAASATAFNPEPHTLLIVMAPVEGESPPKMAACRAGFCPSPAETTLPMMHSSTSPGSMAARFTASPTAIAPSCGALKSERLPWNFPTGVRQPDRITTSSKEAMKRAPEKNLTSSIIDAARRELLRRRTRPCALEETSEHSRSRALVTPPAHSRATYRKLPRTGQRVSKRFWLTFDFNILFS